MSRVTVRPINMPSCAIRRDLFRENNSVQDVNIEFFPAVDGKILNFEELVHANIIDRNIHRYNRGIIGCALSHRKLWELCIQHNSYAIICEDDCILRKDFASAFGICLSKMPPDWDFLLLGWNTDSCIDVDIIPGVERIHGTFANTEMTEENIQIFQHTLSPVIPFPLNNMYGMPCYAISPKGAKILLDKCFPLKNIVHYVPALKKDVETFTLDCVLNVHYSSIKAYACLPPIAVVPNDKTTSDIPRGTEWTQYNDEK